MEREPEALVTGLLMNQFDQLLRYVITLVGNETEARDILQETSVALILKAESYDDTRPFFPWACRFAYLEILKFREKSGRNPILLEDDVLEIIANEQAAASAAIDPARDALDTCLAKLSDQNRNLLMLRYNDKMPADDIGLELGISRRSVFRLLKEVREKLQICIKKEINYA